MSRDASRRAMAPALAALLLLALVLLPVRGAGAFSFFDDPGKDCVEAIAKAIQNSDTETFERLVNIGAVASQAYAEIERIAKDPATADMLPPLVALLASKGALTSPLSRDFIVNETRSFVLYGVGSGAFAGNRNDAKYKSDSMLAPLFELVSMGRKDITDIGKSKKDGKNLVVPFTVRDAESGGVYKVIGELSPAGEGFRLTAIRNMRELVEQVAREHQKSSESQDDGAVEI